MPARRSCRRPSSPRSRCGSRMAREPGSEGIKYEPLTARELEVLRAAQRGGLTPEICDELCIAPNTLRTHVQNITGKLRVHSKLEAVVFALRHGLVDPPTPEDRLYRSAVRRGSSPVSRSSRAACGCSPSRRCPIRPIGAGAARSARPAFGSSAAAARARRPGSCRRSRLAPLGLAPLRLRYAPQRGQRRSSANSDSIGERCRSADRTTSRRAWAWSMLPPLWR